MKPTPAQPFEMGDIVALSFDSPEAEAAHIVHTAQSLRGLALVEDKKERGISWSDMAVLLRSVRTNGEPITKALSDAHIPYVVVGMNNLFGTEEAEAARQLFYFMAGRIDSSTLKAFWMGAGLGIDPKNLQHAISTVQKFCASFDNPTERFGFYSIQRTFLAFLEEAGVRGTRT